MPKFIFIDPSIIDVGGHYYEYAVRVLHEASRRGFEPVLAANQRARCFGTSPWRVLPVYRYGFFEPGPPRALRWGRRVASLALCDVKSPRPTACQAGAAGTAAGRYPFYFRHKRRAFFADTARLCDLVSLDAGDIVFLPTVAEADMLGLADFFRADRTTTKATWHLLFRRDVPRGNAALQRLRRHFEEFTSQLSGHLVSFYTDTEPLTDQFNRLGAATFRTLPIPIHRAKGRSASAGEFCGGRPGHVVYLGDARTEKGYHWLPRLAIAAKAASLPVRFTFQSNFSVPGGEPAAAKARAELAALPADFGVTLVEEPLSSDAYLRLLLSADVVIIPYDAAAYRARSSGVFAEALGAGKPVIVPEGTWMAEELRRAGGKLGLVYSDARNLAVYLAGLLRDYGSYQAAAQDHSLAWSDYHSPQTLWRQLAAPPAYLGSPTGLASQATLI